MNSVRTLYGKKNAKNYVLKPFNFFKDSILCAKCPERILDNVVKPFNKPYTALKCTRIQIYFFKNHICETMESTSYAVQQIWPEFGRFSTAA